MHDHPTPRPETTSSRPRRVLVTAGPTHEPIDAVRYLANRSSGQMGVALAEAAAARGWATTLLLGPVPRTPSLSTAVRTLRFHSTADLQQLLSEHWPQHDVLIMAAAVADYRPAGPANTGKIARGSGPLTLALEPTPDLLAGAAASSRVDQTLIGFALAPTGELDRSARRKIESKNVNAIVANALETMDAATISATVYLADGTRLAPGQGLAKPDFAQWLLEQISTIASVRRAARP